MILNYPTTHSFTISCQTHLTGAEEYAEHISTKGLDPVNYCPGYDTKPSDDEAPVLKLWRMLSTSSLPLFPCQPWHGVVVLVRVQSMNQRELFILETI